MRENIDILLITAGTFENRFVATNISKLIKILLNLTNNMCLVTLCDKKLISNLDITKIYTVRKEKKGFTPYIFSQILISKALFSLYLRNNIKVIIFAFGQDLSILPIVLAKIAAKRIIIRSDGRPTTILKEYFKNHSRIKRYFLKIIEEINYGLADVVLTECEYMISDNDFQKYNSHNGSLFVDINKFKNETYLYDRRYDIGFVGRLDDKEKGILNFLKALTYLSDFKVLIIGDGVERDSVLCMIHLLKSTGKSNIKYIDWVENSELPNYLNEIKLLVVPSYKEGLPNIVLESMACGTLVLSTPVGGVPGVIRDGETGFILENNLPSCIAKNVMRALEHSDLERVVKNARVLVEKDFAYEAAVDRYREILKDLP